MLSFFAPGYIITAVAAAAALVASHFIVRRTPRAIAFPTARFVPDAAVLTTGWARAAEDLAALVMRVLTVLLAGLALAGPYLQDRSVGTARVIVVDGSRAVADTGEVRDSVAAVTREGDIIVGYASSAAVDIAGARGTTGSALRERGSLTAALVAATRAASALRDRADSIELVVVSTFAREQLDAATERVRREWPGRARLMPVSSRMVADTLRAPALAGEEGDLLAVALASARARTSADVRIARGVLTGHDSAWIAAATGRVLVHWPGEVAPAGFIRRNERAPAHALLTESASMIAPFEREWRYVPAISARPVAWWIDGDVAAAETAHANGCIRSVAVPVSAAGDFVLRPDFHSVLRDLVQPCGGARQYAALPPSALAMLRGPPAAAQATAFAAREGDTSRLAMWPLLAALACALLELAVRGTRTKVRAEIDVGSASMPARRVA